jgi:AcrR family transcriptional regulator
MEQITPKTAGTKERIVEEASFLFGKYGYNGTSIRDIAKRANVNVAAINYHFINKQNLYKEILSEIFNRTNELLKRLASGGSWTTQSFITDLYERLTTRENELFNNIKIFLSPSPTGPQIKNDDGLIRMPGEEALALVMEQEHSAMDTSMRKWATQTILRQLVQAATLINYSSTEEEPVLAETIDREKISLGRTVKAIVKEASL